MAWYWLTQKSFILKPRSSNNCENCIIKSSSKYKKSRVGGSQSIHFLCLLQPKLINNPVDVCPDHFKREWAQGYDLQHRLMGGTTGVMGSTTHCYLMNHRMTVKAGWQLFLTRPQPNLHVRRPRPQQTKYMWDGYRVWWVNNII